MSSAEAIKKWVLVPDEWTEEAGQMTPSMKLKRGVVQKEYEAQIARREAKGARAKSAISTSSEHRMSAEQAAATSSVMV